MEKETIYTEEVGMLMKGASYKEVVEAMEKNDGVRKSNPFVFATTPSKEHVVEEQTETPTEESTETESENKEE